MFRRKEEEFANNEANPAQQSLNVGSDTSASGAGGSATTTRPAPAAKSAPVARPSQPKAAASAPTFRPASSPSRPSAPSAAPAPASKESPTAVPSGRRVLTVGHEILLKGEIATCDRLVIQGEVDAKLKEVHTVEISETGSFKGTAQIEEAIVSGLFDGELLVRGRLVITGTGRVTGKVSYGEIEIQRGGELSGEISMVGSKIDLTKSKIKQAA